MERPVETQPSLSVWINGEVWSYTRGGTRIYAFDGREINIWDHATGAPGIGFNVESVEAAVREWLKDEEEDTEAGEPEDEVSYQEGPPATANKRRPLSHGEKVERWGYHGEDA